MSHNADDGRSHRRAVGQALGRTFHTTAQVMPTSAGLIFYAAGEPTRGRHNREVGIVGDLERAAKQPGL